LAATEPPTAWGAWLAAGRGWAVTEPPTAWGAWLFATGQPFQFGGHCVEEPVEVCLAGRLLAGRVGRSQRQGAGVVRPPEGGELAQEFLYPVEYHS